MRCAVIGAGIGGLAASIRLVLRGAEVHLFEQHAFPGGKAGELTMDGYRFDTGPSLLTMPFILEELFLDAGVCLNSFLTIERLNLLCRYFYPNRSVINAFSDINAFADEIALKTADTADSVLRYLDHCRKIYELTADLFLYSDFSSISSFLNAKAAIALFNLGIIDPFRSMHAANSGHFSDQRNIQLFNRYATYNGSNPYQAPATLNMIQHVEFNLGGFIVREGLYKIPQALSELAILKGVTIHYNTPVHSIVHLDDRVTGLDLNHRFEPFDCVVSNVDVAYTYTKLIKGRASRAARSIAKREPSSSALIFYWGMRRNPADLVFDTHNILFSSDYQKEFEDIFVRHSCPEDPTIYVYISSRFKSSDAPAGCDNWFVMINAPCNEGQNWEAEAEKAKVVLIERISAILHDNIAARITCESISTPVHIEARTGSLFGSLYGPSSNSLLSAFFRQPNKSRDYRGLFFCGGSSHPGGGIPLVLLSAKNAADSAFAEYQIISRNRDCI